MKDLEQLDEYVIEFEFVTREKFKVKRKELLEFLRNEHISRLEFFEPKMFMRHNNHDKLRSFREVFRNEKFVDIDDFLLPNKEIGYKFKKI